MVGSSIDTRRLAELAAHFRGSLIRPGDDEYDRARRVWNTRFDGCPGLVARCADAGDVIGAVRFARDRGLHPAIRGGGHSDAGHGTCDGDMVIDLSTMRLVDVRPERRRARAEGGATWADLDLHTQRYGLATPGPSVSSVGIGGSTLGGGFGYLSRAHGLSADNLVSADIVTADAELRTVTATRDADLFWAIRGGGGNFGVVTSFEYELHPIGPIVLGGMLFHPYEQAPAALRRYRDMAVEAPAELSLNATIVTPPAGMVPGIHDDRPMIVFILCWHGTDLDKGAEVIRPLRRFGPPIMDTVTPMPYRAVQQLFDVMAGPTRLFRRGGYLDELTDEAIDIIVDHAARDPSVRRLTDLARFSDAVTRAGDHTACGRRSPGWLHQINALWTDEKNETSSVTWVESFYAAISTLYAPDRMYINHVGTEGEARVRQAYANGIYERLAEVKTNYDPHNLFRRNHNIVPG